MSEELGQSIKHTPQFIISTNLLPVYTTWKVNRLYLTYMGVGGGGLGGFRPLQNPKYPTQTHSQTRCLGKILTKNVFLRPFWAIFRPASGIFRKVALPRFLELPTFVPNLSAVKITSKKFQLHSNMDQQRKQIWGGNGCSFVVTQRCE